MTEDTAIERAAFALYVGEGYTRAFGSAEDSWKNDREDVRETFRLRARLVVEALRPELEMVRDHIIGSTGARHGSDSEEMVQAINAILAEA